MAKGTKTGGRDFEPGVSGNPNGRPPLPADLKATRDLDQAEFERLARGLMRLSRRELNELLKDEDAPAQVVMIARIVRSGMWSSDQKRLDFLMTRLVGRPKTYEPEKTLEKDPNSSLSDEELEAQAKALAQKVLRKR